jgi:hypothetical protein
MRVGVNVIPRRFTPGKETRCPSYSRLGGLQGQSGRVGKVSPPLGFDSRTVQPVASRYTDYAILAHELEEYGCEKMENKSFRRKRICICREKAKSKLKRL